MYKITIRGMAETSYDNVKELHGIGCQEDFTDYFCQEEQCLKDKGVSGGYMFFEVLNDDHLWTTTTYTSREELTLKEIELLANYTQGQWSDGIGEGFEQEPCYFDEQGGEVYISPWHRDQYLITQQEKVKKHLGLI